MNPKRFELVGDCSYWTNTANENKVEISFCTDQSSQISSGLAKFAILYATRTRLLCLAFWVLSVYFRAVSECVFRSLLFSWKIGFYGIFLLQCNKV